MLSGLNAYEGGLCPPFYLIVWVYLSMSDVIDLIPLPSAPAPPRQEVWKLVLDEYKRRYRVDLDIGDMEGFVRRIIGEGGDALMELYFAKGVRIVAAKVMEAINMALDDFVNRGFSGLNERERFVVIDKLMGHLKLLHAIVQDLSNKQDDAPSYVQGKLL